MTHPDGCSDPACSPLLGFTHFFTQVAKEHLRQRPMSLDDRRPDPIDSEPPAAFDIVGSDRLAAGVGRHMERRPDGMFGSAVPPVVDEDITEIPEVLELKLVAELFSGFANDRIDQIEIGGISEASHEAPLPFRVGLLPAQENLIDAVRAFRSRTENREIDGAVARWIQMLRGVYDAGGKVLQGLDPLGDGACDLLPQFGGADRNVDIQGLRRVLARVAMQRIVSAAINDAGHSRKFTFEELVELLRPHPVRDRIVLQGADGDVRVVVCGLEQRDADLSRKRILPIEVDWRLGDHDRHFLVATPDLFDQGLMTRMNHRHLKPAEKNPDGCGCFFARTTPLLISSSIFHL